MNSEKIHNLEQLVTVQIWDFYLVSELVWESRRRSPFHKKREGFYASVFQAIPYTREEIEGGKWSDNFAYVTIKEDKVYDHPQVQLVFTNGKKFNKYFKTYEEALTWGREQAEKGMNVRLTI